MLSKIIVEQKQGSRISGKQEQWRTDEIKLKVTIKNILYQVNNNPANGLAESGNKLKRFEKKD